MFLGMNARRMVAAVEGCPCWLGRTISWSSMRTQESANWTRREVIMRGSIAIDIQGWGNEEVAE